IPKRLTRIAPRESSLAPAKARWSPQERPERRANHRSTGSPASPTFDRDHHARVRTAAFEWLAPPVHLPGDLLLPGLPLGHSWPGGYPRFTAGPVAACALRVRRAGRANDKVTG